MGDKSSSPFLRGLGVLDASALVVGCIIGAGIFRLSDSVARQAASPAVFLLAWVVGGLLSLCGALCYAELSSLFPKTGGDYVFLTQAYGRFWGFLFGWTKVFVERTGTIAILAFVFAEHAARVFGFPPAGVKIAATAAIVLLTTANAAGLKFGKGIQNTLTVLKLSALAGIVLAGLICRKGSAAAYTPFWPAEWSWGVVSSLGVSLIYVLWTFGGWTEAAYVAEEVREPERNLPRAIVGGLLAVTGFYLLVNAVYLYYLPLPEMRQTDLVAAGAMDKIWPGLGGRVVAAMVMASTLGALNGFVLTGGRILYALGRDHALFHRLASVSAGAHTPVLSLIVNSAIAVFLVWTGTLDQLVEYTQVVISVFFALSGAAIFIFRRRGLGGPGTYRVWGYPVTPIVFITLYIAFIGNALVREWKQSLLGLAVASLGVPLYWISRRLKKPA